MFRARLGRCCRFPSPISNTNESTNQPTRQIQSLKAAANQAADQAISQVRLVRAFAAEEVEKRRYDGKTLASVAAELRVKMLYAVRALFGVLCFGHCAAQRWC